MKLPDRIIIDIRESAVIMEDRHRGIIYESIPRLVYCQNVSNDGIDISIDISIPKDELEMKGDENTDNISKYFKESIEEQPSESEYDGRANVDYTYIQDLFDKVSRYPYDEDMMQEFIDFNVKGQEDNVFEYKKELFKDALKEPKINAKRREWLKQNKIRLLNSRN